MGKSRNAIILRATLRVEFQVFSALTTRRYSTVSWDVTPCSPAEVQQRFARTYCLHIHGRKPSQAGTQQPTSGIQNSKLIQTKNIWRATFWWRLKSSKISLMFRSFCVLLIRACLAYSLTQTETLMNLYPTTRRHVLKCTVQVVLWSGHRCKMKDESYLKMVSDAG
jgi:hypothetical protein